MQHAHHGCVAERGAEGGLFSTVANDDPLWLETLGAELSIDAGQQRDVLLDREAADVAEHELPVIGRAGAFRRSEGLGFHAALHQVAGTAGGALQQRAEPGVGRVEHLREAVKAADRGEASRLYATLQLRSQRADVARQPPHPPGGVLMDVGVPARRERDAELVREVGTEDAELAGAGDVDDVGAEGADRVRDEAGVAEEQRVEAEVFFEVNGQRRAAQLEGLHRPFGRHQARGLAGTDAEHGDAVPARVGGEVAAGVCDAVDLVEAVGKVGDSGQAGRHRVRW